MGIYDYEVPPAYGQKEESSQAEEASEQIYSATRDALDVVMKKSQEKIKTPPKSK